MVETSSQLSPFPNKQCMRVCSGGGQLCWSTQESIPGKTIVRTQHQSITSICSINNISCAVIKCSGITSSEDLVRLTGNASSDNFAKKWSSALDPIGGGRKHTPNHIQKQPFSNKKRQTPPHKQKYTQEDSEEHVYGVSPVYIALLTGKKVVLSVVRFAFLLRCGCILGRRDITEAFIQEGLLDNLSKKKKDPAVVKKIVQLCEQRKIPISHVSKHSLNMMTDNKPHQGLVLRASYLTPTSIASLPRVNTFKYDIIYMYMIYVTMLRGICIWQVLFSLSLYLCSCVYLHPLIIML